MLRSFIFLIVFTVVVSHLSAQDGVTTMFEKGIEFYSDSNYDSAIYYFERAAEIANTVEGPSYWKGRTANFLSLSLIDSDPELSLELFNQAVDNYQSSSDNGRLSQVYRDRAVAFKRRGNRTEALKIFERGFNYISNNILDRGDSNAYMAMQRSIVDFHLEIGDTKRALEQLDSSILPDGTIAYEPYKQYADVYLALGQFEKAVENYNKALQHQKAETIYNISRDDYRDEKERTSQYLSDTMAIAYRMNSLAEGLLAMDELALAKAYMDTAAVYFKSDQFDLANLKNDLALYAIKSKDYNYAQSLLDELELELNEQFDQAEYQQFYDLSMRLAAVRGTPESFDFWRLKKDSLDKKLLAEGRISAIEAQRNLDNARAERIQLEQQGALSKRRNANILMGIGLLALGVLVYYFAFISKRMRLLSDRNELLVREQNHRVKNNLQMINSLLSLQAGRLKDEQSKDVLKRSQTRIQAISLLNRALYEQKNISRVKLNQYIEELAEDVINSITDQHVVHTIEVPEIDIDIDKATSLGLIINELIVNSIKHNTSESTGFYLGITEESQGWALKYSDNNKEFDLAAYEQSKSFGKKLIELQAKQLKANLEIKSSDHFELKLVFNS